MVAGLSLGCYNGRQLSRKFKGGGIAQRQGLPATHSAKATDQEGGSLLLHGEARIGAPWTALLSSQARISTQVVLRSAGLVLTAPGQL